MKILFSNSDLLVKAGIWAAANWLLDAFSLWVFLLAFGAHIDPIDVLVAYGLANILAVIPLTPERAGRRRADHRRRAHPLRRPGRRGRGRRPQLAPRQLLAAHPLRRHLVPVAPPRAPAGHLEGATPPPPEPARAPPDPLSPRVGPRPAGPAWSGPDLDARPATSTAERALEESVRGPVALPLGRTAGDRRTHPLHRPRGGRRPRARPATRSCCSAPATTAVPCASAAAPPAGSKWTSPRPRPTSAAASTRSG